MGLIRLTTVTEMSLLIAFFDLTQFARWSKGRTSRDVFDLLDEYFEFIGEVVGDGGGTVVKFIGDAGLLAYPERSVDSGVRSLKRLCRDGDAWLKSRDIPCRNIVKAHFGELTCGPLGTRQHKSFDVCGDTVNTAAQLQSDGMAITSQVFHMLSPETRQLFRKHAPSCSYIPVDQRHED